MPAQPTRVRKRILVPLALALLLLEAVFLFYFHGTQQTQLQDRLDRDLLSARQALDSALARQEQVLALALEVVGRDRGLADSFLARDRELLLRRAREVLAPLRHQYQINLLTFADNERQAFLRVHNPTLHGDRLERLVMRKAETGAGLGVGLDLGPWGYLSLRAAKAWDVGGRRIGLLETGTELRDLVYDLRQLLGLEFLVVLDKQFLRRDSWEAGMNLLGRAHNWNQFPQAVVVESTMAAPPAELADYLDEGRHKHLESAVGLEVGSRTFRVGFIPLLDAGGRRLGDLLALRDVTPLESQARTATMVVTLVGLAAGLGLTLLFSAFLGRLEQTLAQAQGRVLELERDRSRFILENLPAHIALMDEEGRFAQWGERSREIFGYPPEMALSHLTAWDLFQDQLEAQDVRRRFKQQGEIRLETQGKRADGSVFWMRFSVTPLPHSQGGPGLLNLVEDISDRRRAEAALQESLERLRVLSEKSPLGICLIDPDGQYSYLNPAFIRMFGYDRELIPSGAQWMRLVYPDPEYRHQVAATWLSDMSQLAEGQTLPRVFQVTCASRVVKTVLFRPVILSGGGHLVICEDMSDRMEAERAVREGEQRYRRLFESAHDGILVLRGNIFVDCNPRVPELFGWRREEIVGKTPWDISPPLQPDGQDSKQKSLDMIAATVDGRPQSFTWRHLRADGETFEAELVLSRLEIAGQPHILAIVRDITERVAAENALKQSEEQLFKAFRKSPLWVSISTMDEGRYLDVNDIYCEMTGFPREEVVGRTSLEINLWEEPEQRQQAITFIERQGYLRDYPLLFRRKSGELRQGLWSAEVIEVGGKACLISVVTDITDSLAAQEALRESEERYRQLTDNSLTGVYVHQEGRFLYVNRRLAEYLGQPIEKVVGHNFWEFVHPEERETVKERGMARSRGQVVDPSNYEFRVLRPDGEVRWLEILATTIHLATGPASIGNVLDITERRRTEQRRREAEDDLRKSEGRYRALLEAGPDPMVIYDMEGKVTFLNRAFTRVFGWNLEERLGRNLDDFVPKVAWPETMEMIAKALNGEGFSGVETRRLTKAGEIIPVSISGAIFLGGDGQPLGSVSIIRDIREPKRLASELFQAKKMEVIGTLASGIAHDFNNILGAVLGYAERAMEMAKRKQDNTFQVEHILGAAERAGKLVRQILAFSRKEEVEPKTLDLNRQVAQVVQLLGHTIPKMINIETKLDQSLRPISADAAQMDQVLLNLATNAVDAMPDGGTLLLETENITLSEQDCRGRLELGPGNYVLLTVSDTGHGMDENVRQHIFDPFFTTKEVGKGTGLGLSTVYGIVKNMDGHVSCYSEPGMGTSIKIYLRPSAGALTDPDALPAVPQVPQGGNERILLADDEEELRDLAAFALREMGYAVTTAGTGEEALELYRVTEQKPDLVILDLGMPGMGGHRCLEQILETNPQAKVLIASGYSANGQVAASLKAGAADFVAKPFRLAQLLAKVRSVLDGPPA